MNKIDWQKGIKDLQNVSLTERERSELFVRISNRSPYAPIKSHWVIEQFVFVRRHGFVFSLLLIIALGAGTAFASEYALPGGLLYPIKINVNEPARGAIKILPEEKIEWEAKKAERRIEEAVILKSHEELNEEKQEKIETLFEKHKESFKTKSVRAIEKEEEKEEKKNAEEGDKRSEKAKKAVEKRLEDLEKAKKKAFE